MADKSEHFVNFARVMQNLLDLRDAGPVPQQQESDFAAELEAYWQLMSSAEQDDAE
jgi:hypothetical protein